MTRAERLDRAAARAKAQLEAQRKALAQIQAAQHDEERKALTKRRLLVGTLVEQAGLFALSDTVLTGLFAALSHLVETPDPVALLDALLSDVGGPPGRSVPGCAHPTDGVAPTVPL
jgi:hypothetical protein